MYFAAFDPEQEFAVTYRRLPHWHQPGVTCFVTFRTIDSIPAEVYDRWSAERDAWLRTQGVLNEGEPWEMAVRRLPAARQTEFHRRFAAEYHAALDKGYGECVLRRPDLAQIVADSLRHFDGVRYLLGDFVVVPNHVHLLVAMLPPTSVTDQCKSWKKFTAVRINKALGRSGHFWQGEGFDHLVRSPEQCEYLRRYIAENPERAGLRPGEYLYCRAE